MGLQGSLTGVIAGPKEDCTDTSLVTATAGHVTPQPSVSKACLALGTRRRAQHFHS